MASKGRAATALLLACAAAALLIGRSSAPALAATCDEFTGASGEKWGEAANWSEGIPGKETSVCLKGKTVVVEGSQEAGAFADAEAELGSLELLGGGSLQLQAKGESKLAALTIRNGALVGGAETKIHLGGDLLVEGGTLESLTLSGAAASTFQGSEAEELKAVALQTNGLLTLGDKNLTAEGTGDQITAEVLKFEPEVILAGDGATFTAARLEGGGGEYGLPHGTLTLKSEPATIAASTHLLAETLRIDDALALEGALGSGGEPTRVVVGAEGSLSGGGTIEGSLVDDGTVHPGSPLTVTGTYKQNPAASLDVELDGRSEAEFGRLAVDGTAELEGTLELSDGPGFQPGPGERFRLIVTGSATKGTFGSVAGSSAGLYTVGYEAEGVTIEAQSPPATTGGAPEVHVSAGPGASSSPVAVPAEAVTPGLGGVLVIGDTLACSTGTWSGSPTAYSYQWRRDGTVIAGATGQTYALQAIDAQHTISCAVVATNSAGSSAPAASAALAIPSLLLSCSDRYVELQTLRVAGNTVLVYGVALGEFAGKRVKISVTGVPPAGRLGGSATVSASGTFVAHLRLPRSRFLAGVRYQASVAGHDSLLLRLAHSLSISREAPAAGGLRVTFKGTEALARGAHTVTIVEQIGCTRSTVYAKKRLRAGKTLTLTLPAPSDGEAVAYYRAQTTTPAGLTYSLPIAVPGS